METIGPCLSRLLSFMHIHKERALQHEAVG